MSRVYITGLGVVSPVGASVQEYWTSMLEESHSPSKGFPELADRIDNRYMYVYDGVMEEESTLGRTSAMSLEAAGQALRDAGAADADGARGGVAVGTTMGDEAFLEASRGLDSSRCRRTDFPFQISASIARRFHLQGPNFTISNACTSGLYGIDLAAGAIRRGEADMMIAGGVESASRIVLSCFNRLGALDQGKCRPFDKDRQGAVLGEGAAYVVLESAQSMRRRGHGYAYCELRGSGWSCDAYQPTAPEPGGEQIERALRESLRLSDLSPDDIDCVLPHATGTPLNDSVEVEVLNHVFGQSKRLPVITAIKSKLGHSGGAAGAFSVLTACLIFKYSRIPPTANLRTREANFNMPMPVDGPLDRTVHNILVNAYAFGGNNISLVLSRP